MRKFFGFVFKALLFGAFIAGIVYVIKQVTTPPPSLRSSGGGVLPSEPIQSLDDAPLGGQISDELLKILVCPEDKGPLELVDDGKFLLNPRNGYKYPIRNGIPVMLIEEGRKYQDMSLIRADGAAEQKSAKAGA